MTGVADPPGLLLMLYLGAGGILLVALAALDGVVVIAALDRDLRSIRGRGPLALATVGSVLLAGALLAWPVIAACAAITWAVTGLPRGWVLSRRAF